MSNDLVIFPVFAYSKPIAININRPIVQFNNDLEIFPLAGSANFQSKTTEQKLNDLDIFPINNVDQQGLIEYEFFTCPTVCDPRKWFYYYYTIEIVLKTINCTQNV